MKLFLTLPGMIAWLANHTDEPVSPANFLCFFSERHDYARCDRFFWQRIVETERLCAPGRWPEDMKWERWWESVCKAIIPLLAWAEEEGRVAYKNPGTDARAFEAQLNDFLSKNGLEPIPFPLPPEADIALVATVIERVNNLPGHPRKVAAYV